VLSTHAEVPLQIHARYSRIEILAAMGLSAGAKIAAWQSGVFEAKPANAELFAFTLDKSSGSFSPTTRYRDYAISRTLIHWESQSSTRADSPPAFGTATTSATAARSCSSPASELTTAPSGSSAQRPTEATSARSPWPLPGSWPTRSPATSTPLSPRRLREVEPRGPVAVIYRLQGCSQHPEGSILRAAS